MIIPLYRVKQQPTNQFFMKREVSRAQNSPPVVGAAVRTSQGATLYNLSEALSTEGVSTA